MNNPTDQNSTFNVISRSDELHECAQSEPQVDGTHLTIAEAIAEEENGKVKYSPLQKRYIRQVRSNPENDYEDYDLARFVAWTWLPGRDRISCPPFVPLRDARLLTMDRFPSEYDGPPNHIALTLFRPTLTQSGCVKYAGPYNTDIFKDFSVPPFHGAVGHILDATNTAVFEAALALDRSIRYASKGKMPTTGLFEPPDLMICFPFHYLPTVEWNCNAMQTAILKALHPSGKLLNYFVSPGGYVKDVLEPQDGFKVISILHNGKEINFTLPEWCPVASGVVHGRVMLEGEALADLPRMELTWREAVNKFSVPGLEWLASRILDEHMEILPFTEHVANREEQRIDQVEKVWRCIPSRFVKRQIRNSTRQYFDMRNHLGRVSYKPQEDDYTIDTEQSRIDIMEFSDRPLKENLEFYGDADAAECSWSAELATVNTNVGWAYYLRHRGAA